MKNVQQSERKKVTDSVVNEVYEENEIVVADKNENKIKVCFDLYINPHKRQTISFLSLQDDDDDSDDGEEQATKKTKSSTTN